MSTPTTTDCVVCDGVYGCEFCPKGWSPPEDVGEALYRHFVETTGDESREGFALYRQLTDEEASCPA